MNFFAQDKKKALTFSFDDGVVQDIRMIELMNKYGLKGTFNLNSMYLSNKGIMHTHGVRLCHYKVGKEDVKDVYAGHEVAVHTLTHPNLTECDEAEIIRQVEQDRLNLSALVGYEVVGMAYPCGGENNDDRTAAIIREHTGVRYARALKSHKTFSIYPDLYRFQATVHHHGGWDDMWALADRFLTEESDEPMLFYIWGHAYEFDIYPERWEQFEEFCRKISGKEDVFYGTNRQVLLGDD